MPHLFEHYGLVDVLRDLAVTVAQVALGLSVMAVLYAVAQRIDNR